MTAVERLLGAIGYPEPAPAGATKFTLKVDGGEMLAYEDGGRIVLERALPATDEQLADLAGYAAGRLLREDAVLAWSPERECPILWQASAANAGEVQLKRFFEVFAASCDWWLARCTPDEGPSGAYPQMVFRP